VEHAATHQEIGGHLVEASSRESHLHCKMCGSSRVFRVFRQGFLQEKVYPLFGYYPWRCRSCRGAMMLRKRKIKRTRREVFQA